MVMNKIIKKKRKQIQYWPYIFQNTRNKFLKAMHLIIDFYFDGGGKNYATVTKYGAKWISNSISYPMFFDK